MQQPPKGAMQQFGQMKFHQPKEDTAGVDNGSSSSWRTTPQQQGQGGYATSATPSSYYQPQQGYSYPEPWSTANDFDAAYGMYGYGPDYSAWGHQQQQGGRDYYSSPYSSSSNTAPPDFSQLSISDTKKSWASIASQPAKPTNPKPNKSKNLLSGMPPPPIILNNTERWGSNSVAAPPPVQNPALFQPWEQPQQQQILPQQPPVQQQIVQQPSAPVQAAQPIKWQPQQQQQHVAPAPPTAGGKNNYYREKEVGNVVQEVVQAPPRAEVEPKYPDESRIKSEYNPTHFDLNTEGARFFVIKSYSEDDIHRSIKYEIWCSTEHGNKRLDTAYRSRPSASAPIYLFFSVNSSGHFCGMAEMKSAVDYDSSSSVWSQNKWKGQFRVKWIYVKDVPNSALRQIKLENNEGKSVTNSRDTQEVPLPQGKQVLRIIHSYHHTTSIFDDFVHYEKRQEEEDAKRVPAAQQRAGPGRGFHHGRRGGDFDRSQNRHPRDQHDFHGGAEHHNNPHSQQRAGGGFRQRI